MARRSVGSVDVYALASRMSRVLVGARLANFYEEGGLYLARFKGSGGLEYVLLFEPGVRVHGTRRVKPSGGPQRDRLSLLVRKHLRGSRLEGVEQLDFDRVLRLSFQGGWSLYLEAVPRGVAALVGPDGVIVGASRHVEMRDRVVRPGVEYRPPPPSGSPLPRVDVETVRAALAASGSGHLVRALVRGLGLPGEAAEEAAYRAGLPYDADPSSLDAGGVEALAGALRGLLEEAREARGFRVEGPDGASVEATPFRPTRHEGREGFRIVEYDSIDDALDDHFALARPAGAGEAAGERARLERALEEARRAAEGYSAKAGELRRAAEAVAARYHEVAEALECAWSRWRSRGAQECPMVVEASYRQGFIVLDVGGARVKAYPGEGVDALIARLYREAGELEAKARRALERVREAEERLRELARRAELERLAARVRARRRYWFERYHWIVTRSGFLAVGGRDADQNEAVVKRYLGEDDIFMHADIHGAPAVVVLARGRQPPEEDLMDAAVVAAAYSRAWREGLGSVRVYWAWGRQVSKSPPAGEYLAKGAFMVYGRKNYLPPIPVRLALGVALDTSQDAPMVIVGPEDLVAERSLAYALLAPGDEPPGEAAGRLRRLLASRLPDPDALLVEAVPVEEFRERLPGRVRVLRAARGRARGLEPPGL